MVLVSKKVLTHISNAWLRADGNDSVIVVSKSSAMSVGCKLSILLNVVVPFRFIDYSGLELVCCFSFFMKSATCSSLYIRFPPGVL